MLAGIAIGLAGFGFLAAGIQSEAYGPLFGAVLFSFGLLTVVGYKLRLYTGTAGFINKGEVGLLAMVLLGNILGCLCSSLLARVTPMDIQGAAQNILELRLRTGALRCGLLGIGCGSAARSIISRCSSLFRSSSFAVSPTVSQMRSTISACLCHS